VQVLVTDAHGRYTKAGSEVRVYQPGTRTLVGTRLVDTGSGYCSQNLMPVHIGLPADGPVDVEVTSMSAAGRKITRLGGVDPNALPRRVLKVAVP
ncbi:MAG: ASPIC/UnbV domain-containing protein, partial [Terriglobales bacterium]